MTAQRPVGVCSECGSAVVRLAVEGELASCLCGESSISEAVLDTARQMNPQRERHLPVSVDHGERT